MENSTDQLKGRRPRIRFIIICCAIAGVILFVAIHLYFGITKPWLQMGDWYYESYPGEVMMHRDREEMHRVSDGYFQLGDDLRKDPANDYGYWLQSYGTYPSIDGSTVCEPMAKYFDYYFLGAFLGLDGSEEMFLNYALVSNNFSRTHGAYVNLIQKNAKRAMYGRELYDGEHVPVYLSEDHPVDLFLGTAPSADEFALAESEGVTLVQEPVCWDAFVFIVNARNPVDNLSLDQIRDIYSGEITSWKDVGGRWKAITPYQRNANSGSQTAMESMVMQGEPLMPPIMGEVRTMDGLVEAVADFDNGTGSIGYTFLYYVDEMYKDENIKLLSIDGVAPTEENIRSGAYPLAVNYYAVYREEDEDGTAGKFTEWILSEEGQMVVEQAGYIPMDSGARPE